MQLADILLEKIKEVGGKAALGRLLGGVPGQTIFQYTQGVVPSLDFAIKWKKAFNENLIDLLFTEDKPPVVNEPTPKYETVDKALIEMLEYSHEILKELNDCRKENKKLLAEKEELKNFTKPAGRKS
jgi:hypothetical protein